MTDPQPDVAQFSPAAGHRYTHGHHESVLRSHQWRTAENSAGYLLPFLRPGQDILDVGCGPGTITVDLARRIGTGHVVGVDNAAAVIEIARNTARESAVTQVDFAVGDVYHLDFPDATFDIQTQGGLGVSKRVIHIPAAPFLQASGVNAADAALRLGLNANAIPG